MKSSISADISLLFVALIWGATFVVVQNAISFLDPLTFNAVRFTLATGLLGVWLILFERRQLRRISPKLLLAGFFLGFWLFIGYGFQTLGLVYTTSSKAAFITGLSVIMVPLFTILLLRKRLTVNAYIGVAAATVGLYLLTMTDVASLNIGDALVFVCAIGFALQILLTGKYTNLYPTLLLTVVQIATVAILSAISAFLFEDYQQAFNPTILFRSDVIMALIITALFATAFAYLIQTNFQKHTTATRVALIFAMEPVFAAITGFLWAGDRLSYSALTGCLLIFVGMILAELPSKIPLKKRAESKVI
ncbi:DMT family transporter [Mesobacillus maritimus]|uniref:DMT family transporter n=1 Tax=Mesobacillus maritimus TaxID=1643336 RepID=UPI00203D6AF5|nr:DMT family transporter [Mesobacillus maritimus]MCM3588749.1 DMT family transporter [Mesobacillus maritimus]MCM3672125.1 DMT family transporter [Mesobacillus maritimus]